MRLKNNEFYAAIKLFIESYISANNYSPSNKEIANGTGLSAATVSRYMQVLRERGELSYSGHRSIITKKQMMLSEEMISVPVLGSVSCGLPKFAEENIEEYVRLPVSLFGRGEYFLLRANGESMIEAGIDDGDLVLIKQQNYAESGQIVIALMEDEATLKRFYPEPHQHRIRLHPENSSMEDIFVKKCLVQGVAVNVLKNLD